MGFDTLVKSYHREEANMELYLARHGETDYNAEYRYQGNGQYSTLTPTGIKQAKALGKTLEHINFDAVYVSPLKRATDTVELVFGSKYQPILDPRLVEIGLGAMEGMLWDDATKIYPEAATKLFTDTENYTPPPEGEALPDMINRISSFMDDVAKTGHKKVFVLAHGYVMRVFYACTVDKSLETILKSRSYNNCEIARYTYNHNKWGIESC